MQVEVAGELVADSANVIEVDEDGSPPRYYFPREDVKMDKLARTQTSTECPFKGKASYYSVNAGRKRLEDVIWTYEEPYQEHAALQGRLAFWDEKSPEVQIKSS